MWLKFRIFLGVGPTIVRKAEGASIDTLNGLITAQPSPKIFTKCYLLYGYQAPVILTHILEFDAATLRAWRPGLPVSTHRLIDPPANIARNRFVAASRFGDMPSVL